MKHIKRYRLKWFIIGCITSFFITGIAMTISQRLYDWFNKFQWVMFFGGLGFAMLIPTLCGIAFIVWVIWSIAKGR